MRGECVYVLTNKAFPDWVIVGHTEDVKDERDRLDNICIVPHNFEITIVYGVVKDSIISSVFATLEQSYPEVRYDICKTHGMYKLSLDAVYEVIYKTARRHRNTDKLHRFANEDEFTKFLKESD